MQQATKTCSKCKEDKPLAEFHKDRRAKNGLRSQCKLCEKATQAHYWQTEKGKASQARYAKSEKGKVAHKRFTRSIEGRATQAQYRYLHSEHIKARNAVTYAIQTSKLPRPASFKCAYQCGRQAEQYHHWKGYEPKHALDVVPACIICHKQLDKKAA